VNKYIMPILLLIIITPIFALDLLDNDAYNKLKKQNRIDYDAELISTYADSTRLKTELEAKVDSLHQNRSAKQRLKSEIQMQTSSLCRQGNMLISDVFVRLLHFSIKLEPYRLLSPREIITKRAELDSLVADVQKIENLLLPVIVKLRNEFECVDSTAVQDISRIATELSKAATGLRDDIASTGALSLKSQLERMKRLSDSDFLGEIDSADLLVSSFDTLKKISTENLNETVRQMEAEVFAIQQRIVNLRLKRFKDELTKYNNASGLLIVESKNKIYKTISSFRNFRISHNNYAKTEFDKTEKIAVQLLQRIKNVIAAKMKRESPNFIFIKGGEFADTLMQAEPEIVNSFFIAKWETTWKEYLKYCNETGAKKPTIKKRRGNYPVVGVSWYDALKYCNWLSMKNGFAPVYNIVEWDGSIISVGCNFQANGFRLPTFSEWKYAAEGGNAPDNTPYYGSDEIDRTAWYKGNSKRKPRNVGSKMANSLGVFDMSGNVCEWCWDGDDSNSTIRFSANIYDAKKGKPRWSLGGHYNASASMCSKGSTDLKDPKESSSNRGFRLVRSIR